ncbi:MAG: hypothetical protein ACJ77Z_14950 [Thermoleophilaceae bacterium]|jgi:hypothetical protein
MLAVVRPDSWNLLLFIHVAGAMALVGSLILAGWSIRIARTRGDQPAAQFAYRVLWRAVLPSYVVMRVGAQLIASKEKVENSDDAWVGIGFTVSDAGLLLLIIGLILAGLAARRAKRGQSVAGSTGLRVATILTGVLVAAYVVAIWAMTTKPV